MDDKELLELAAKAAGIRLSFWNGVVYNSTDSYPQTNIYSLPKWNPLTDDGDALRLAVKLRLDIEFFADRGGGGVVYTSHESCLLIDGDYSNEELGNDPYAATRRAIVRASAEIGKGMK